MGCIGLLHLHSVLCIFVVKLRNVPVAVAFARSIELDDGNL